VGFVYGQDFHLYRLNAFIVLLLFIVSFVHFHLAQVRGVVFVRERRPDAADVLGYFVSDLQSDTV